MKKMLKKDCHPAWVSFYNLMCAWDKYSGREITNQGVFDLKRIASEAFELTNKYWFLKKIDYCVFKYFGITIKFPESTGDISLVESPESQYYKLYEQWQTEMYGEGDRIELVKIHDIAKALIELFPLEISSVMLPEPPLYNKFKYVMFPVPAKYPSKFYECK